MLIGNIGVGLFVLIIVWILALIVFVFGIKFQNNIAWVSLSLATVFTITLVVIPLDNSTKLTRASDNLDKDYMFIYQAILLSFLIISALIGFIFFFILHCLEPVRPKGIKQFSM